MKPLAHYFNKHIIIFTKCKKLIDLALNHFILIKFDNFFAEQTHCIKKMNKNYFQ